MSNYCPVSYEDASPELKSLYDDICNTLDVSNVPAWASHMGRAPHLVMGMWSMVKNIVLGSHLSPLLTELLFFAIAHERTVPYCMDLHADNILRLTQSLCAQDLIEIVEGNSQGQIPASYQCAINISVKLAQSDCALSARDYQRLREAGFDDIQCMEINTLVSAAMFFNVYSFAADLPVKQN